MNNVQVNCHKCSKMFSNFQHLSKHSETCNQEENTKTGETTEEPVKFEIKPLPEVSDPLAVTPSVGDSDWAKTEKASMEVMDDYNNFMKTSSVADLDEKVQESEKEIHNVDSNASLESIEIPDSDDEDKVVRSRPAPHPNSILRPKSSNASTFKAPKPPPPTMSLVRRPMPLVRSQQRLDPLQCVYCRKLTTDRIALARHLIAAHWAAVRERQGGGRRDNSHYYANIEDNRTIKPAFKHPTKPVPNSVATANLPMNNVQRAAAVNNIQAKSNPKWLNKLNHQERLKNYHESLDKVKPKVENVNKKVRSIHNPSWYQSMPNRKIQPKGKMPAPMDMMTFDLTKPDPDACEVCDDDFNWPDENHECNKTRKNKMSNGLNNKKVLQQVQVSDNIFESLKSKGSISKNVSISRPINNRGKDLKNFKDNLVTKLSTKSTSLQITPVMKKV